MNKLVLDATCGSRMIWFNKNNELAVFVDKRELDCEAIWTSGSGQATRYCNIHPNVMADFTDLPFEDNTFYHVVFDPPHLIQGGDNSWMVKNMENSTRIHGSRYCMMAFLSVCVYSNPMEH